MTPDMVEQAPELRGLVVSAGDVIKLAPAAASYARFLEANPQEGKSATTPYHSMLSLPTSHPLALAVRVPNSLGFDEETNPVPNANLSGAVVVTDKGYARVTPAALVDIARQLHVDILSLAVEDVPASASLTRTEKSLTRNLQYTTAALAQVAATTAAAPAERPLAVFVPIEGGRFPDRRKKSVDILVVAGVLPAPEGAEINIAPSPVTEGARESCAIAPVTGVALGGLSTAESSAQRKEMAAASVAALAPSLARSASVVGHPREVVDLVAAGVDVVGVSYPIALADVGLALTLPATFEELEAALAAAGGAVGSDAAPASVAFDEADGLIADMPNVYINMRRARHAEAAETISGDACYTCRTHSRGYIHHLLNAHEMLAEVLLTLHNVHAYGRVFAAARAALEAGPEAWTRWRALTAAVYPEHDIQTLVGSASKRKVKPRDMRDDE
jgi:queuine/archaeosine tRNA-ribosyltransferase